MNSIEIGQSQATEQDPKWHARMMRLSGAKLAHLIADRMATLRGLDSTAAARVRRAYDITYPLVVELQFRPHPVPTDAKVFMTCLLHDVDTAIRTAEREADAVMSARNGHPADRRCGDWTCPQCGTPDDDAIGTLGITDAWAAALVERCARLGHDHVPAGHPHPDLEAVAGSAICYLRNFAGLRVLALDEDEWAPATVTDVMWRGDGLVVRFDRVDAETRQAPVRLPFARLRLSGPATVAEHRDALVEHVERQFAAGAAEARVVVDHTALTVTRDPDGAFRAGGAQRFATISGALGLHYRTGR
jgi:hypothetical protein